MENEEQVGVKGADSAARIAGISSGPDITLQDVDKRRAQLWSVSLFVFALLALVVGLLSFGRDILPESLQFDAAPYRVVLILVGGLGLAFVVYVIEKERSLRRLTGMLVEERVLSAALSNRLAEISALSEVGKAVNTTLDIEDVFNLILSSALELCGGTEGSIMMLDEDRVQLEVVSYQGPNVETIMKGKARFGVGIAGTVAATRQPMLIQEDQLDQFSGEDLHPDRRIYSSVCVPLIRREELLGVLNLSETEGKRRFSDHDLSALELFAEHAAIAIGNARLFEKERETISRLEELDRLKSDFVATVSHELKTPLTAIIGAAKTVLRRPDMNDDQHTGFMEMIERQGNRLLRLVDDVLTAARIESGLPRLRRERVNMKVMAEAVIEDVSHAKVGTDRVIELHTEPDQPHVWGDPIAVQQIMINLIENALKYSEPDTKVRVWIKEGPADLTLEIADEGHGIPPEQLSTIFDRFRQIDSSSTRTVGGFGLGLYIVKNLVESHRGQVDVKSEVGVGTTFRVHFPKRADER